MEKDRCEARIIHREKVEKAVERDLSIEVRERLSGLFKGCSDSNRLRILHALLSQEMCVCDLAVLLGSSESAVSHQLRLLRSLGLVRNRREGTVLYYQVVDPRLEHLFQLGQEITIR
mgnify:CR=1 FL=1